MSDRTKWEVVPLTRKESQEFIRRHHRHHKPHVADVLRIGMACGGSLVGVAVLGRPMARMLCDGLTLEVVRLAVSDDAPTNA